MTLRELIYNGFYALADEHKLSSDPAFSAWWMCCLSTTMYLISCLFIADVLYGTLLQLGEFPFTVALVVVLAAFAWMSESRGKFSFFGASFMELPRIRVGRAKLAAIIYFFVGAIFLAAVAFVAYD